MLKHLSLFSGIGGLDLAAEAAGFTTVGQCEWADYPTKILEKRWPDVPRWRDIRTLTGGDYFAKTGYPVCDIISGGFPCQPFSVAGKRRGTEDDRYLWPEMLRVISEIRPAWVIGENVPGIINMALDQVLTDLESQGYACQAFNIPACGVDAPHKRARIAIVANAIGRGCGAHRECSSVDGVRRKAPNDTMQASESSADVADTLCIGGAAGLADTQGGQEGKPTEPIHGGATTSNTDTQLRDGCGGARHGWPESANGGWWPAEPDVGRVANGIPSRVDRLKCLGNAVVPQQFYPFFRFIADIERGVSFEHS